jgi:hypothetical protein
VVQSLRGEPAVPASQNRRWVVVGAVAVALVVFGAAAWWFRPGSGDGSSNGQQTEPLACPPAEGQDWSRITLTDNPSGEGEGPLVFTVKDARWRAQGEGTWRVILTTAVKNGTPKEVGHGTWWYDGLVVAGREFAVSCFAALTNEYPDPGQVSDARVGFEVTCKPVGYIELVVAGGRIRVSNDLEPGDC